MSKNGLKCLWCFLYAVFITYVAYQWQPILGYTCGACVASTIFGGIVGPTMLPKEDPFDATDLVGCNPIYFLIVFFAIGGTVDLYHDIESRWHGVSTNSELLIAFYVSRQLVHLGFLPIQSTMSPKDTLLLLFHHVISGGCFGMGLYFGHMHFFATFGSCCEVSTIFLNFFYMMKNTSWKGGSAWTINGICLWGSFLVFRMILFPTYLWIMFRDYRENPARTFGSRTWLETVLYPVCSSFIYGLSIMWFVPLTKGLLKTMRPKRKAS